MISALEPQESNRVQCWNADCFQKKKQASFPTCSVISKVYGLYYQGREKTEMDYLSALTGPNDSRAGMKVIASWLVKV